MANAGGWLSKSLGWRLKLFSLANKASFCTCQKNLITYVHCMCKSFSLYKKHGFMPDEALKLGLLEFKGNIEESFISKSHLVSRQKFLNHPSFQEITEDKAIFYSFCAHLGIPTPKLHGLFFKNSSGLLWDGQPLTGEAQWADFFENNCPDEFVVKPSRGVYGDGILFIDKNMEGFSGAGLYRALLGHMKYDSFVVQDCLQNHPDLMAINPKRGLQTVRVITFVRADRSVDILMAYLKPIVGDNRIDNQNRGFTGNLLCQIDLENGILGDLAIVGESGVQKLSSHPDNNISFKGKAMPLWEEICALAEKAALAFLPMRSIGWDIAVTQNGPFVIEGNSRWDPPKFGSVGFLLRSLGDSGEVH